MERTLRRLRLLPNATTLWYPQWNETDDAKPRTGPQIVPMLNAADCDFRDAELESCTHGGFVAAQGQSNVRKQQQNSLVVFIEIHAAGEI